MFTVPLESFLAMCRVRPHQELLADGTLVEYQGSGKAIFVSHQWVTEDHPDPKGEQLKVLQAALLNLRSGAVKASLDPTVEFNYGRVKEYTGEELAAEVYVWYDYFGCPQMHRTAPSDELLRRSRSFSENPFHELKAAIASIPYYVSKCDWFIALCPTMSQVKDGYVLDQDSWTRRGWCMCEKMVRELSAHGSKRGLILMVESPKHLTVLPVWQSFLLSLGDGEFTFMKDLPIVCQLIKNMLEDKLETFVAKGDLHSHRFFLNQQYVRFRGCHIDHIEKTLTGQTPLENFYLENRFTEWTQRDEAGWSPLCYAAVRGSADVVADLLKHRADPLDCIRTGKEEAGLPNRMPVLSLCAYFGNNQAMKVLLEALANPNQRDGQCGAPLFWGNLSDNAEGAQILMDAKADPLLEGNRGGLWPRRNPPWCPVENAAAFGARKVMEKIYPQHGSFCDHLLHNAFLVKGGSPDFISSLIELKVDINEQFRVKKSWFVPSILLAQHRLLGASKMTTLFYHRVGSTPLMMAILSGSFGAAERLLSAKARVDLKNKRKQPLGRSTEPSRASKRWLSDRGPPSTSPWSWRRPWRSVWPCGSGVPVSMPAVQTWRYGTRGSC